MVGLVRGHEAFMREALALAGSAAEHGEVPIGAVVVLDGEIVGRGHNQPIAADDPTAHAEIVALRDAAGHVGNYRLTGASLYVTVEPCLMCVGAMIHARVGELVFGTTDPKTGAIESVARAHVEPVPNHQMVVVSGVLGKECRDTIQHFFRERRKGTVKSGEVPKWS